MNEKMKERRYEKRLENPKMELVIVTVWKCWTTLETFSLLIQYRLRGTRSWISHDPATTRQAIKQRSQRSANIAGRGLRRKCRNV